MQIRNINFTRGEKLKRIPDNPAELLLREGRCVPNLVWLSSLADTAAAQALQELAATDAARVGDNVVVPETVAGTLWSWARLAFHLDRGRDLQCVRSSDRDIVLAVSRDVVCALIEGLARSLDRWARRQEEPSTHTLLATHTLRARMSPLMRVRLMQKANPRAAAAAWREDSSAAAGVRRPNIPLANEVQSARYANLVVELLKDECVLELVFDATRFASTDTDIYIVYAPGANIGAYLPPQALRELAWRTDAAVSAVSAADRRRFLQTGMRTRPKQKVVDCLRTLNHVISMGLDRSLATFAAPCRLALMQPAGVRYWNAIEKRWYRMPGCLPSCSSSPELPDQLLSAVSSLSAAKVQVLLLTVDQKQTQWSAVHYLADPAGLNLFVMFRGDPYHRSWNDFKTAAKRSQGRLDLTMIQMTHVTNVNYGPYGNAANMAKKRELKLEFEQLCPRPEFEFDALAGQIAIDARKPRPASEAEVKALYEAQVLDDVTFVNKGEYTKQSAWYSIVKALHRIDPVWHTYRYHMEQVAYHVTRTRHSDKTKLRQIGEDLAKLASAGRGDTMVIVRMGERRYVVEDLLWGEDACTALQRILVLRCTFCLRSSEVVHTVGAIPYLIMYKTGGGGLMYQLLFCTFDAPGGLGYGAPPLCISTSPTIPPHSPPLRHHARPLLRIDKCRLCRPPPAPRGRMYQC